MLLGKIFRKGQLEKIRRFVKFVVFCYIPWWLTAPIPSSAPKNDQLLMNSFLHYKNVDEVIANEALLRFGAHMWYLTEELIPLSFFSNNVSDLIKQAMTNKLLATTNDGICKTRFGSGFGKPQFPQPPKDTSRDLDFYIGGDSWMFFNILKIDSSFLRKPVVEWKDNQLYKNAKLIVDNIKVVNDAAERGLKLAQDFQGAAQKEQHYQNILQVVENSRKSLPNQRKQNSDSLPSWYLML